jgi:hypothetical protein
MSSLISCRKTTITFLLLLCFSICSSNAGEFLNKSKNWVWQNSGKLCVLPVGCLGAKCLYDWCFSPNETKKELKSSIPQGSNRLEKFYSNFGIVAKRVSYSAWRETASFERFRDEVERRSDGWVTQIKSVFWGTKKFERIYLPRDAWQIFPGQGSELRQFGNADCGLYALWMAVYFMQHNPDINFFFGPNNFEGYRKKWKYTLKAAGFSGTDISVDEMEYLIKVDPFLKPLHRNIGDFETFSIFNDVYGIQKLIADPEEFASVIQSGEHKNCFDAVAFFRKDGQKQVVVVNISHLSESGFNSIGTHWIVWTIEHDKKNKKDVTCIYDSLAHTRTGTSIDWDLYKIFRTDPISEISEKEIDKNKKAF